MERNNKLLKSIIESMPFDIYFKDTQCRYRYLSRISLEVRARAGAPNVIGKTDFELFEDQAFAMRAFTEDKEILRTQKGVRRTIELKAIDGSPEYYDVIKEPVVNVDGESVGIIVIAIDVKESVLKQKQLEKESEYDRLTGLCNQRAYLHELSRYRQGVEKTGFVAIADINNMKVINDIWGHSAGDDIIIQTSNILMQIFNHRCKLFRIGGDEFAVIGEDWENDEIQLALSSVNDLGNRMSALGAYTGLSVGYAKIDGNRTIDEAIEIADEYMYFMKSYVKAHQSERVLELLYAAVLEEGLDSSERYIRMSDTADKLYGHFEIDQLDIMRIKKIIRYEYLMKMDLSSFYSAKSLHGKVSVSDTGRLLLMLTDSDPLIFLINSVFENWDGKGFPGKAKKYEIPFYSQIVRLLTILDEIRSLDSDRKKQYIKSVSGTQLSPNVVGLFLDALI